MIASDFETRGTGFICLINQIEKCRKRKYQKTTKNVRQMKPVPFVSRERNENYEKVFTTRKWWT